MTDQLEFSLTAMHSLALCDLSRLRKFGAKGRDVEQWLAASGIDVPENVFETRAWSNGGLISRFGSNEFFLEDGPANCALAPLIEQASATADQVFSVEHQEATFLLTGTKSLDVLSQTCGINFRASVPGFVVMTRVAGVSCVVLPQTIAGIAAYRVWVDPSYAESLWEVFAEISDSIGGRIIEASCVYPELLEESSINE